MIDIEEQPSKPETSTPMARSLPLTIIVAASYPGLGIGKGGALPWPMLKGEMGFFSRVTRRVDQTQYPGSKRAANAVIMGRKTWESIPEKLRPLKERVNVVISSSMQQPSLGEHSKLEGPFVRPSLGAAIELLEEHNVKAAEEHETHDSNDLSGDVQVATCFVIGGASIYNEALKLEACNRVLLTKIRKQYDCDVHFPIDVDGEANGHELWDRCSDRQWAEFTGEWDGEQPKDTRRQEAGIDYEFCLYEKTLST